MALGGKGKTFFPGKKSCPLPPEPPFPFQKKRGMFCNKWQQSAIPFPFSKKARYVLLTLVAKRALHYDITVFLVFPEFKP